MRSVCPPTAPALVGPLCAFVDLILIDATVIRLHALLKDAYVACRTNHTKAACKLHLVYSVLGKSEQKVKLTCERTRESRVLTIGSWVKDRLLLFDLGYFKYALFERISRFGGYFISRLKGLCNPKIIALNVPCRGRARPLVGKKLKDVLKGLKRQIIDVQVEVRFPRRIYKGKRSRVVKQFRVVGVYNTTTGAYHLYITNISPKRLSAKQIAHLPVRCTLACAQRACLCRRQTGKQADRNIRSALVGGTDFQAVEILLPNRCTPFQQTGDCRGLTLHSHPDDDDQQNRSGSLGIAGQ